LIHLTGLAAAHNDHTIAENQQNLLSAGFAMSAATTGGLLLRLKLTRKKRRSRMMRRAVRG
jgi:hypothetical protein